MIAAIAVKLMTWAISLGLSPMVRSWWDGLNDLWDIVDALHAPPRSKEIRSRMFELMRQHEARRMVKALRS